MLGQRERGRGLSTGELLGGRYELRAAIGQGGMAEVFEAFDVLLDRRVAVKVLREGLARDARFLARFRREARAAAALSHQNIVGVHDFGTQDDRPYLVMELVPGRTLAQALRAEGRLDPTRAAAIGEQIAAALAVSHAHGIVHRDISPGNVMLTPDGRVKVLDFGIARAMAWTPVTGSPQAHGTAAYLSPEQARGLAADERSDVYALGVVLYEMLTGRPPFSGESAAELCFRHVHEAPLRPRVVAPDVPEAFERAVLRCLSKDPAARYVRAGDLRWELGHLRGGGPSALATLAALPSSSSSAPGDTAPLDLPTSPPSSPVASRPTDTFPLPLVGPGGTAPLQRGHTSTVPMATVPRRDLHRRKRRRWLPWTVALTLLGGALTAGGALLLGQPEVTAGKPDPAPARKVPPPLHAPAEVYAIGTCDGWFSYRADLTWTQTRSRAATGYEVRRSLSPDGPYEVIALIPGRGNTYYGDAGLGSSTTYYYRVNAVAEGRHGPLSAEASAQMPWFCLG
jgi:serine/threonine protein kinase